MGNSGRWSSEKPEWQCVDAFSTNLLSYAWHVAFVFSSQWSCWQWKSMNLYITFLTLVLLKKYGPWYSMPIFSIIVTLPHVRHFKQMCPWHFNKALERLKSWFILPAGMLRTEISFNSGCYYSLYVKTRALAGVNRKLYRGPSLIGAYLLFRIAR